MEDINIIPFGSVEPKVYFPTPNNFFLKLTKRKVTFALKPMMIFIEIEDRKGPWETIALDRYRFNCRIKDIDVKIGWCFQAKHREKIFNQRY